MKFNHRILVKGLYSLMVLLPSLVLIGCLDTSEENNGKSATDIANKMSTGMPIEFSCSTNNSCGNGVKVNPVTVAPTDLKGNWTIGTGVTYKFSQSGSNGAFEADDGKEGRAQGGYSIQNGILLLSIQSSNLTDPLLNLATNSYLDKVTIENNVSYTLYLRLETISSNGFSGTVLTAKQGAEELSLVRLACASTTCGTSSPVTAKTARTLNFAGDWNMFYPFTNEKFSFTFDAAGNFTFKNAAGSSTTGTFIVATDIAILKFNQKISESFRTDENYYFRIKSLSTMNSTWSKINIDQAVIDPAGVELPFTCKTAGTCGSGKEVTADTLGIADIAGGTWILDTIPTIPINFVYKADGTFTFDDNFGHLGKGTVVFSTGRAEVNVTDNGGSPYIPKGINNYVIVSATKDKIIIKQIN